MEDVDATNIIQNENGKRAQRTNSHFDYKAILDMERSDSLNIEKFWDTYNKIDKRKSEKFEARAAYTADMGSSDIRVSTRNTMMDLRKTTNHVSFFYVLEHMSCYKITITALKPEVGILP